jgi:hypothetical protein
VWVAVQSTDVGGSIDGYVVEYSPSGTELTLFYASGLTNPTSIAVLQNGNLAVTDSHLPQDGHTHPVRRPRLDDDIDWGRGLLRGQRRPERSDYRAPASRSRRALSTPSPA